MTDADQDFELKIGEIRSLYAKKGHRWVDENNEDINQIKCELKQGQDNKVTSFMKFHQMVDIDECSEDAKLCKPLGHCINQVGSNDCQCIGSEKMRPVGKPNDWKCQSCKFIG